MRTPTIRVGGETIWLDKKALRRGEVHLDRESVSQQCDGCGQDIAESGVVRDKGLSVQCEGCNATYPVTIKEIE